MITWSGMIRQPYVLCALGVNTGPLSKGQRRGGRQCTDTQDLYLKVRGEVGTQHTDTQDLYLKVRAGVGTQCRDTQDLYLKMGGEVGTQCTHSQYLYLKVRGEVGTPWYTLTGLLSKGQRRGGNTV